MGPCMRTMLRFVIALSVGWLALAPGRAYGQAADHKTAADRLLQRGHPDQAMAEYHRSLALEAQSPATYFNLAIAAYSIRNLDQAAWALEKLLELDPQDVEALYNLGCLELYRQDLRKARTYLERARGCCNRDRRFAPLIDRGLGFVDELEGSPTQGLVFLALQDGLPSLALG